VRRRSTRPILLLAGVALAGALFAAAELVLRIAGAGVVHPLHEFTTPDGRIATRFESLQELEREPKPALDRVACDVDKAAGTIRVVVVGESTAAGFPFFPHLSFGRVVEMRLRHDLPALAVEVVNFGRAADSSANVLQTLDDARRCAPDVVVICSGHNEYQASYLDDLRDGTWPAIRRVAGGLRLAALLRPAAGSGVGAPLDLAAATGGALVGTRPFLTASEFARGERRLRDHLDAMVTLALDAGALPLLMTQPSNLADFPPCHSFHSRTLAEEARRGYESELRELLRLARAEPSGARAAELARELEAADPDVALLRYAQGLRAAAAGDRARARDEFERALELDDYPNRARAGINRAIAQVGAGRGIEVVDAVARFAEKSALGVPGDDLFLDHCHPTLEGTFELADALLPSLARLLARRGADLAGLDPTRATLAIAPLEEWLARMGLDRPSLALGAIRAGEVDLKLVLLMPGVNEALRLARRAFTTALRLDPGATRAKVALVVVELLERDKSEALRRQDELLREDPGALRPLEEQSRTMTSLTEALHDLGLVFEKGRLVPAPDPPKSPK
jgi:tetratricopeptide (TPR) repeat protein